MNERIEAMKAELAARRAAALPVKVKEVNVTLAERIGRRLARTKNAVVGSVTGISNTLDAIGTSYSYYSEVPPDEQCGNVPAPAKQRRRTAAA